MGRERGREFMKTVVMLAVLVLVLLWTWVQFSQNCCSEIQCCSTSLHFPVSLYKKTEDEMREVADTVGIGKRERVVCERSGENWRCKYVEYMVEAALRITFWTD